jgi:hypothetical protein
MQNRFVSVAVAVAFTLSGTAAFAATGTYTAAAAANGSDAGAYPAMTTATEPPVSKNASNITAADMHSDIGPPLPMPVAGADATPVHYLHAASRDLSRRETGAAQQALEMAETRLLDRSVIAAAANQPDTHPAIGNISNALDAIGHQNLPAAQDQINLAMSHIVDDQPA